MADVIAFDAQKGEPWFKDGGGLAVVGEGADIILIQSWQVTYQQAVQPLYECGTSTVYFSSKHQIGQLTVDRVWAEALSTMKDTLGEICAPKNPTVRAWKCAGPTAISASLKSCFVTGINLSGQAQQGHVGENVTAQFVSLEDA